MSDPHKVSLEVLLFEFASKADELLRLGGLFSTAQQLAEKIRREYVADAWDEGWEEGNRHSDGQPLRPNPYRK